MRLKILTLTTVYPGPLEPELGIFVRTRLQHVASLAEVKILAPAPLINYARRVFQWRRVVPLHRSDGALEVISPRWFYPPSGGAINALFLFLRIALPVARLRKNFRFDLIDAHFAHPEGVAAALTAALIGCPFTVTLRGNEQMHARHALRRACMAWALRRAGRVLPVSEKLRTFAIGLGSSPSKVVTIPNGIDTALFHPRDREVCRSGLNIAAGKRVIGAVGHLIELKGHHRIIRAVRTLVDQGVDAMLLIAGGRGRAGDYEPALRAEIASLGLQDRVRLLGHVDREGIAKLMSAVDVFCLASAREGWPNVIHEALACGLPVVATNVGGVPEMIPSDQFGIVVPPGDDAGVAAALGRALKTEWDREAIARWGQARSWGQVAAEVVREMELVCEEFRSGAGPAPAASDPPMPDRSGEISPANGSGKLAG